jgi:hypothetical protein
MIHILNESPYVGYFENVAERISVVLTEETREAILRIKSNIPNDRKVASIQIDQAVIESGIRSMEDFWRWQKQNPVSVRHPHLHSALHQQGSFLHKHRHRNPLACCQALRLRQAGPETCQIQRLRDTFDTLLR